MNKKVLKQKKPKNRKRYEKRKYKNKCNSFKIFAANAAGIKCKTRSFDQIISSLKPKIWILEETKLKANEKISCEAVSDFQIFYLNRQNLHGGGIAIGVDKSIESPLVREGDDTIEAVSV